MKVMHIYRKINDKTWIFQVFVCGILILIYYNNEVVWNFIRKFSLNHYLMFIITWLINFTVPLYHYARKSKSQNKVSLSLKTESAKENLPLKYPEVSLRRGSQAFCKTPRNTLSLYRPKRR